MIFENKCQAQRCVANNNVVNNKQQQIKSSQLGETITTKHATCTLTETPDIDS